MLFTPSYAENKSPTAIVLKVDGPISPAVAEYLISGLETASKQKAKAIIIQMDTPGGLGKSMRTIIKAILNSPIPVITYVSPSGARAASAGTFILYASQIAAMAPGTNLGSATPVRMTGPQQPQTKDKKEPSSSQSASEKKSLNDAIAYIKSLAMLRGRNAQWAVKAVKEAANIPATEALKLNVIDVIAPNIQELLTKVDGKKVKVQGETITLATKDLNTEVINPDWRNKFLEIITNPTVAYILLLIAAYGLFFEFASPGFILPGVVGAICLLLALYAFHLLPVSYIGLGLILLGIAFMLAEVFMPSFGALGIGGLIAFAVGSIMLIETDIPGFGIPLHVIITMSVINLLFFFVVIGMAIRARQRPVVSGHEAIIGEEALVDENYFRHGTLNIAGETWRCKTTTPLSKGQKVQVVAIENLIITVTPIEEEKEL